MKRIIILLVIAFAVTEAEAQYKPATIKEFKKVFKTYAFSDPDPIAEINKIYPYYRFDGYTNTAVQKEWKVVELENEFIKVWVLPEIGGKIWSAWEKSTGKPFIYYNQVVKFRDVAMRGPWTSGGIEANYGIVGHTPNCATPMDYVSETKNDGSVSCYIGTLDLLTQTYWTIEVNLPKDKAYFTTKSFWNNSTPLEQPYYTWMNTGLKSKGNLEFIYPGNRYIGHGGEYDDWTINPDNGKDISFYENNNFGGYKSYHVFGKYTDFFGAYYHEENFGMARYSLRDEKPGKKIWIWGLSQQGMIWEKLLSDTDGQYVEVQSGRLFNQAADESNNTPFKQLGFAPYTSDEWTEYWFPVKGTMGFVKANRYGALNIRTGKSSMKIDFFPLQDLEDELKVYDGEKLLYSKNVRLKTSKVFSDSINFTGNRDHLIVKLGQSAMEYRADPQAGLMNRPVKSPEDFDWNSVFGLYTMGKEFLQQRYYPKAQEKLEAAIEKDPNYLPALSDLAMLAYRNLDYEKSLRHSTRALSIDTYDAAANFYYGLANNKLGKITDAKDGFDIASLSYPFRGAAYTELSKIYFQEGDYDKSRIYAEKSLEVNAANTAAWQIIARIGRITKVKSNGDYALDRLKELTPLNHFIRFEQYRWQESEATKREFTTRIQNEMPHETYLELADWYLSLRDLGESLEVLKLAPENPEVYYRMAFLKNQIKSGSGEEFIEKANRISPALVFPFRATTAEALEWVITQTHDWKPKYYLALIHWSRQHTDRAKELFAQCGDPDFSAFFAARAGLFNNEQYSEDLKHAARLDPGQWRYGKLLADYFLDKKNNQEALAVATDYHKRFPRDFRINMLLAKTLLHNNRYKETADLLGETTILPYEGATDGRRLYREAWLMQAVAQIKSGNYKSALISINKAKEWPENLGAGKPYEEDIDLRLENYMEALILEKTKQKEKAKAKYEKIAASGTSERHQINDLLTALALRKTGRNDEGKKVLDQWKEKEPGSKMAGWAYSAYHGEQHDAGIDGNDNFRVVSELMQAGIR
jgi:tetratricopeptide (TPR) repeat protein